MVIHRRLTKKRKEFLLELTRMDHGEPSVRSARHACLKLGWCQGVYKLTDGTVVDEREFDRRFPRGTERWNGVKFAGLRITELGRDELNNATTSIEA